MTAHAITRLKIMLDDVKPQVVRRIEVPLAIRPPAEGYAAHAPECGATPLTHRNRLDVNF